MNACLKNQNGDIVNPKIPRYEKESVTFTVKNTSDISFTNTYKKFPFDTTTNNKSKKFILQSDGSVLIGKGIKKNSCIWFDFIIRN